mgnify:CR=1 FL=1|jgi:hypothetical protein
MPLNRVKENENSKFENKPKFAESSKFTENIDPPALVGAVMQLGTIAIGLDIICFSANGAAPITNIIIGYSAQVITQVSSVIISYSVSTMISMSVNTVYTGASLVLGYAGPVKGPVILAASAISVAANITDFLGLSNFKDSFPILFINGQVAELLVLEAFGVVKGSLLLAGAHEIYNRISDETEPEFTGESPSYDS